MFEIESEKLNELIKSRTIGLEENVNIIQIMEAPVSAIIKNYFKLEAETLLYNEKYFNINKERFDITNINVVKSFLNIEKEKQRITSLSLDDIFVIVPNTEYIYKSVYNREIFQDSKAIDYEDNNTNNDISNDLVLTEDRKETKKITEIIDHSDYEFTVISKVLHSNKDKPISFYISVDDEKMFIKKLFDKNIYEYKATIKNLSGFQNWQEASSFISDLFEKYKIDPYSKPAINFTDKIHSGFLNNDVH
jgi:hypothetical protein